MKKILLVEDTVLLAEEIVDILSLEGYDVTHALNGMLGILLLPEIHPDIIITDLLMPGMNGFEFIKRVKVMPGLKSVPIIILSAKISDEDMLLGIQAGADDFIQKPCKASVLLSSIRAFTDRDKGTTGDH